MKKINHWAITLATAAAVFCLQPSIHSQTQTNTNTGNTAGPTQNFFQSAWACLSAANTNYTWAGVKFEGGTGARYMSGVNWANTVDLQYDPADSWGLIGTVNNSGVAGTVQSEEAGVSYALIEHCSVKLQAELKAGYDQHARAPLVDPGVTVKNKLTANTFASLRLGWPIWLQKTGAINQTPDVTVAVGFTY